MPQTKKRKPAARRNGTGGRVDALGRHGKVKLLAEMLAQIQAQQLELDTLQAVNGAKASDPAANAHPDREGNRPTYAEKRRQLQEGERRFYELHAKHLDEIRAFLAGVQAAQEG